MCKNSNNKRRYICTGYKVMVWQRWQIEPREWYCAPLWNCVWFSSHRIEEHKIQSQFQQKCHELPKGLYYTVHIRLVYDIYLYKYVQWKSAEKRTLFCKAKNVQEWKQLIAEWFTFAVYSMLFHRVAETHSFSCTHTYSHSGIQFISYTNKNARKINNYLDFCTIQIEAVRSSCWKSSSSLVLPLCIIDIWKAFTNHLTIWETVKS